MRRFSRVKTAGLLFLAALSIAACDLFSGTSKAPLPGERVAVMGEDRGLEADARLGDVQVQLPAPVENASWPQPGGVPSHAMQHLAADGFSVAWRTSIGSGSGRDGRVATPPIVADGRVYTMDAGTQLTATDASSGSRVWTFDVEPEKEGGGGAGGGVTYDRGRLYVGTGYAQVIALEADSGKEVWRQTLTAPVRAAPTVGAGRLLAITVDTQIHALELATGRRQWTHSGITETAGFYGGSSAAVEGTIAIAAFSSGEILAQRVDNGRVLWSDSLAGALRADPVSSLADIRGLPVVDRGQVFAASNAGRVVAIDLRSGGRIWDQNFGSLSTPWLAGDYIFMVTVDAELVCVTRRDGRIRWVTQLRRFRDEKAKRGRVVWAGPVLAGSKLFVANSEGEAYTVSPLTGEIDGTRIRLPGGVFVSPIVANRTTYVLTDNGDLVALR
jgi:outer membrane protein assembly factor BamB